MRNRGADQRSRVVHNGTTLHPGQGRPVVGLTAETRMGCKPARAIHLAICLQWEALWTGKCLVLKHRDGGPVPGGIDGSAGGGAYGPRGYRWMGRGRGVWPFSRDPRNMQPRKSSHLTLVILISLFPAECRRGREWSSSPLSSAYSWCRVQDSIVRTAPA